MTKSKEGCLEVFGLGLAFGLAMAVMMFVMCLLSMQFGWGKEYTKMLAAAYGYKASFAGIFKATFWGFMKGFVFGALSAFFYNRFRCCKCPISIKVKK